uniref:Uncharacterized protein n=1 Tax=viral metagenome TaxID=1070528 RepID=A0A6C0L146_9ZZZZ|tara:strand:- start:7384 stop:8532 length:1149 start_codon:yes stop_codon:yes gene_type:complete
MEDINIDFDSDNKKINMDKEGGGETPLNIQKESTNELLGVELLTNGKAKPELNVSGSVGGYSSGEESVTKNTKNEDHNFFKSDEIDISGIHIDEISLNEPKPAEPKTIPVDDPMINSSKATDNGGFKPLHSMNAQDVKNEKIDLIYKFKKLESQGIRTTMNYNMNSHLEDMRNEYLKLKKQREVDNSIKFQRKVMMALITGVEFMNNKFDPFDVKLDGWSESVNENINDFDEVFEELSEKYGGKSEIAPELKLLMMLGGSAFMFHLTNTMFKSSIPGMDDIMKQNPDLMKQFAQAAVGSIGKQNEGPPPMRETMPQPQPQPRANDIRQQSSAPDMEGPSGLDDIINQMNLQPGDIPDLDSISLMSGDTDKKSIGSGGMTLNL